MHIVIKQIYLYCSWVDVFTLHLTRCIYILIEQMHLFVIELMYLYHN
jgi:hypothetical protein